MVNKTILEQVTETAENYADIVIKIKKFNEFIKFLQDSDQSKLEEVRKYQDDPEVIALKNKLLKDINDWYNISNYTKQSKKRELVEFTKNNSTSMNDTLVDAFNNIEAYLPSYVNEFEPVFQSIEDNYYVIKDIPESDLVGEPAQQAPSSSTSTGAATTGAAGAAAGAAVGAATIPPGSQPPPSSSSSTSGSSSTSSGPASPEEIKDMIKLHGSFDQNSSLDKSKLEMYRKAKQEVGSGDFSDLAKAAYKIQYGDTSKYNTEPVKSKRAPGSKSPTAPVTPGENIYFVRVGPGNYRPAVNADLSSDQQLFVRNPNKLARVVYPFIKMQNAPVRRADLPKRNK